MKNEIVNIALKNLTDQVPFDIQWELISADPPETPNRKVVIPDWKINFKLGKRTLTYLVEVKNQIRTIHLPAILDLKKEGKDLLVIAEIIYPNIREKLKKEEVNYIDLAGNVFLRFENNIIYVEGKKEKDLKKKPATDRAFNRAGLILIFHLLQQNDYLNRPYREIAATNGIALGNLTYIINSLTELGFLRKIEPHNFKLLNKDDLLQKWVQNYPIKLRPHLFLGEFNPWGVNIRDWKTLKLEPEIDLWGAEPAANLLTNYLVPATLTIYTTKNRQEIITNLKLIPAPKGILSVYRKFWVFKEGNKLAVPPILIYADLLNTGDPRNLEIAKKIYEQFIKEQL
jgi:hypothetical protein